MPELEPDVDVYGTHARASSIADFLELLALRGARLRRATIADYIGDVAWGSRVHETFLSPEAGADAPDENGEGLGSDAEEAAARIYSLLAQRAECLGSWYPFQVDAGDESLEVRDSSPTPYLALLGITIAHAFGIDTGPNPRDVFEDTVSQALASVGHKSLNFSRFRKGHGTFAEALIAAGPVLDLRPAPLAAPISASAQDAGADVLAHVAAGYSPGCSIGAWTLVGQVTCGRSDTWARKLGEVEVPAWGSRLGSALPPQAFLAVPHHAEPNHLLALVINNQGMVLDRLRLTRMLDGVSDAERAILDAVLSAPIGSSVSDW